MTKSAKKSINIIFDDLGESYWKFFQDLTFRIKIVQKIVFFNLVFQLPWRRLKELTSPSRETKRRDEHAGIILNVTGIILQVTSIILKVTSIILQV